MLIELFRSCEDLFSSDRVNSKQAGSEIYLKYIGITIGTVLEGSRIILFICKYTPTNVARY